MPTHRLGNSHESCYPLVAHSRPRVELPGTGLRAEESILETDATVLRVLTYNVRFASDQSPNSWVDRRPVAKSMLADLKPDVIGMQEALPQQVRDFAGDLPGFRWIGTGRDGNNKGETMAVFYRTSRLERRLGALLAI